MKLKIALSGYYGFNNTGDEAILEAIISGFKQLIPEVRLTVLSSSNRFDVASLKDCDIFISGGGGLLQDATSFRSFLYYLGLIWLAQVLGKKTMVFAQGIGPLKNPLSRWLLKIVLNRVGLITVRDENSLKLLKKLGVVNPKTYLTADPSFLLSIDNGEKILSLEGIKKSEKLLAGVSVRGVQEVAILAQVCDYLIKNHKAQIVFIPFQCPQDIDASRKVMEKMSEPAAIIFRQCRAREILGIINQMDIFIGMRLHSLIFAVMNKVPCLGISYDPKVEAFMKDINQPYFDAACLNSETLKESLKKVIETKEEIKKQLEIEAQKLYDRAKLNFKIFQEFITIQFSGTTR